MANPNPSPKTRFQTGKELESIARKGGINSGKSKRALKAMQALDEEITTDEERIEMLQALKKAAMKGNIRAFEVYRDTVGMKPGKHVSTKVSIDDLEEIERFLYGSDEVNQ